MKKILLGALLLVMAILPLRGQRIMGFYPNYSGNFYTNLPFNKLTHLNYFSLNPTRTTTGETDGSLWENDPYSWFSSTRFNNTITKARQVNPNIKIFITSGGSPGNDTDLNSRFIYLATNPAILNTFCNNIINFIKTNNLDGWDLDWEFPKTTSDKAAHQALLTKMRQKIDSVNTADCKKLEITIDVEGSYVKPVCFNPNDFNFVNGAVINYVDYVNLMIYGGPTSGQANCIYASHEDYNLVVDAINGWSNSSNTGNVAWPKSKFVIGVALSDNSENTFKSGGNNSTYYDQTYYNGGSGCPNMQQKIDLARTQGCAGLFIWELTQDNQCAGTVPSCYSLVDCIYHYTTTTWGTWTAPTPCVTAILGGKTNDNLFSVYPNPSAGEFMLSIPNYTGEVQLKVYNSIGAKVYEDSFYETNQGVKFGKNLVKGIYIVEITAGDKRACLRVVKD